MVLGKYGNGAEIRPLEMARKSPVYRLKYTSLGSTDSI